MTHVSDDDLMRMYRHGDAAAFDALFDRHYASVYHVARTMLGDAGGPEEVLQETFLAVARSANTYSPRNRFRTWLMRIARNRCLNRIESRRTRREVQAEVEPEGIEPPATDPAPPERVEAEEQAAFIQSAIDRLPDRQREAIALYAFEGMSYRDVAEVLEMPVNTVKTLIHRARATLAQALAARARKEQRRGL